MSISFLVGEFRHCMLKLLDASSMVLSMFAIRCVPVVNDFGTLAAAHVEGDLIAI
jgi:hypothetical protein